MKIGIDISQLGCKWDGIGTYIYAFLRYVAQCGREKEFYLYSDRPLMQNVDLNDSFHFRIDSHSQNHLLWLLTVLPKRIKADDLDVFWQPNFLLPYKIGRTKNIVTVHDMSAYAYWSYADAKTQISHKLLLPRTCRKADRILAISENGKKEVIRCLKVGEDKISAIYIGKEMFNGGLDADEAECAALLDRLHLEPAQYLLFVGTLSPRKNAAVLLSAFCKYRQRHGRAKLVLAGNVEASCQKLLDKIRETEFKDDVVVTGYVSETDKRILYYHCKMVLYPSRLEGFGFPILEAFQAGKPLITSNVSCMPEIAGDAAVYLNDIDDANELADRIFDVEAFSDEELKRLNDKGKERVEFFDRLEFEKETLNAIRALCGPSAAAGQ